MRALLVSLLFLGAPALAHGIKARIQLGPSWVNYRPPQTTYLVPVVYPVYWYWFPVVEQPAPVKPAPAPAPQIIIEREVVREEAPQIIVIEQPAAVAQAAPAAAPAPAPAPAVEPATKAPAPRVPGPDVYYWIDGDGVTHYSTRAPANAKAKKLSTLAK